MRLLWESGWGLCFGTALGAALHMLAVGITLGAGISAFIEFCVKKKKSGE